jgi:hypothetical protein
VRWSHPQQGGKRDVAHRHVVEVQAGEAGQRGHQRRQCCGMRRRAAAQAQALQLLQGRYDLQAMHFGCADYSLPLYKNASVWNQCFNRCTLMSFTADYCTHGHKAGVQRLPVQHQRRQLGGQAEWRYVTDPCAPKVNRCQPAGRACAASREEPRHEGI